MPGKFLDRLGADWRSDDRLELIRPLHYVASDGREFIVPVGFTTDLASVPRWIPAVARVFMPSAVESADAAVLHDYLYRFGPDLGVTRREADAIFFEALQASQDAAWLMWLGVRAGGWLAWRRNRRTTVTGL